MGARRKVPSTPAHAAPELEIGFSTGSCRLAKMFRQMFVHIEHRYSVAAENQLELIIRQNFALILGVLEIIPLYVGPHFLDDLGPGQRFRSCDRGKLLSTA